MGIPDYPSSYRSTSQLAKILGVDGRLLFVALERAGLIRREGNGWKLTEQGAMIGGRTGTLGGPASFPVWPHTLAIDKGFLDTLGLSSGSDVEIPSAETVPGFQLAGRAIPAGTLGGMLLNYISTMLPTKSDVTNNNLRKQLSSALLGFAVTHGMRLARSCPILIDPSSSPPVVVYATNALIRDGKVVGAVRLDSVNRVRAVEKLNKLAAHDVPTIWMRCGKPPKEMPDPAVIVLLATNAGIHQVEHGQTGSIVQTGLGPRPEGTSGIHEAPPSSPPSEARRSIAVLEMLMKGFDPQTGVWLPEESPYSDPRVIRALFDAIRALEARESTTRRPTGPSPDEIAKRVPPNAGRPWAKDEDHSLMRGHLAGKSISTLSKEHGRTLTAITKRLQKLGLIV